jgi:hypothetical protein
MQVLSSVSKSIVKPLAPTAMPSTPTARLASNIACLDARADEGHDHGQTDQAQHPQGRITDFDVVGQLVVHGDLDCAGAFRSPGISRKSFAHHNNLVLTPM